MKFYRVTHTEDYESYIILKPEWDYAMSLKYEGIERLADNWGVKELYTDEKNRKPDIAYFSGVSFNMLIGEKAYECLKDILDLEDIELLPTKYKEEKYFLLHGIKSYDIHYDLIPILDKESKNPVFKKQEIVKRGLDKKGMFKMQYRNGEPSPMLLFTEKFLDMIEKYDLKGCEFIVEAETEDEYLTETIVEAINEFCENILKQENTHIVDVRISYFYDGEAIDLGTDIRVHDISRDKYWSEYLSVAIYDEELDKESDLKFNKKELSEKILEYLHTFSRDEIFFELEQLAKKVGSYLENKYDWLADVEKIRVECYD